MKPIKIKPLLISFILLTFLTEISAQNPVLFNPKIRWILVDNKIEGSEILLTPYDSAKCEINTLILKFVAKNKIEYDYESIAKVCYGVDFLDMDLDSTSWKFDEKTNLITLTVKGGYSSIEDFKFEREYEIWTIMNGDFRLRQVQEHYYKNLQADEKVAKQKKRRRRFGR
jgi:hypothetical protein